jgi:hypothetical protein
VLAGGRSSFHESGTMVSMVVILVVDSIWQPARRFHWATSLQRIASNFGGESRLQLNRTSVTEFLVTERMDSEWTSCPEEEVAHVNRGSWHYTIVSPK